MTSWQKETELIPCSRARDPVLDEVVVVPAAREQQGAEQQRAQAFPKEKKLAW